MDEEALSAKAERRRDKPGQGRDRRGSAMTNLSKPLTRSVTHPHMPHAYKDRLIISIHPGGFIEVREARRRESVRLDIGVLYVKELIRRASAKRAAQGRRRVKGRSRA